MTIEMRPTVKELPCEAEGGRWRTDLFSEVLQ
jgi:hypothetical protein